MSLPIDAAALARIQQPLPRAWTLPPQAYTEPAVFAAETERLFRRQWLCVARAEDLPEAGDYRCLDLIDQPIVLVRGRDGELRALSRICLHRAMPVAQGAGRVTRFVCPYHHWTYELDGTLRSAPMMDGVEDFDAQACRLPTLRTEVWHGFVFVNGDPDAAPLAPALSGLEAKLRNYPLDDLVVADTQRFDSPWNWKILVENFLEAYHHIAAHRRTLEPMYPARRSFVEDNGGAPWALLRMPADPAAHDEGALPPFADLTHQQRHELIAGCVFPTFLLGATASTVVWYQLEPAAYDRMTLSIHLLLRPEVAAQLDDSARAAVREAVRAVHLEDIPVNEGPWRGLQAPLTRQGRLSLFEKAIWQFSQWWAARMQAGPNGALTKPVHVAATMDAPR